MSAFGVLLFIVGLIGVFTGIGMYFSKNRKRATLTIGVSIGVWVLGIFLASFVAIPAGERGVILRFGKVAGVMDEGLNMKIPLVDSVVNMSVKTELFEAKAAAASKDLQDIETTVAVNYRLDPAKAGDVYRTIGTDYIQKIAYPAVQEVVKQVSAEYNAEDVILKRASVKAEITLQLTERLAERGIIAETVNITNFEFSEEFTRAIESKVVAVQKVLEAENVLKQIEVEARQAEQKAKGEAAANIAVAEGKAKSIEIVTAAQVAANESIADSLNAEVLQYIFYDRLGEDIKVIVIPQNTALTLGDIGAE